MITKLRVGTGCDHRTNGGIRGTEGVRNKDTLLCNIISHCGCERAPTGGTTSANVRIGSKEDVGGRAWE